MDEPDQHPARHQRGLGLHHRVEQGQGRTSYRMTLGVTATTLALDQLDGGTQLPSGAMVATTTALEMSDFDALAVPRVALPS